MVKVFRVLYFRITSTFQTKSKLWMFACEFSAFSCMAFCIFCPKAVVSGQTHKVSTLSWDCSQLALPFGSTIPRPLWPPFVGGENITGPCTFRTFIGRGQNWPKVLWPFANKVFDNQAANVRAIKIVKKQRLWGYKIRDWKRFENALKYVTQ